MPKIVDHETRKIKIAEATWKVIVEEGIENATVRKIAQASGLSVGALRYYFASQTELLHFSMELVSERVMQRVEKRDCCSSNRNSSRDFMKGKAAHFRRLKRCFSSRRRSSCLKM